MFIKYGEANAVVLHGGPGGIGGARSLAKELGAVEVLNYGQSIATQIDEIHRAVVELDMKYPMIIGHSWGAWLACLYANVHPTKKAILIGCGAFNEIYLREMGDKRKGRLEAFEQEKCDRYFKELNEGTLKDMDDFTALLDKMDAYDQIGHESLLEFDLKGHSLLMDEIRPIRASGELINIAKGLSSKLVIFHGNEDPHPVLGITEPFDREDIDYNLYTYEKCGHVPWLERHARDQFYSDIRSELKYDFKTSRLGFRCFAKDYDQFFEMNSDQEIMRYFPETLNREKSNAFHDRIKNSYNGNGYGLYAVDLLASGEFIGFIGLSSPSFDADFTPCVEIGWRLHKKYWRKGYAKEGAQGVLRYARDVLGLKEIVSFTAEINKPSIAVMKSIGMTFVKTFDHPNVEGPLKKHVLYKILLD